MYLLFMFYFGYVHGSRLEAVCCVLLAFSTLRQLKWEGHRAKVDLAGKIGLLDSSGGNFTILLTSMLMVRILPLNSGSTLNAKVAKVTKVPRRYH